MWSTNAQINGTVWEMGGRKCALWPFLCVGAPSCTTCTNNMHLNGMTWLVLKMLWYCLHLQMFRIVVFLKWEVQDFRVYLFSTLNHEETVAPLVVQLPPAISAISCCDYSVLYICIWFFKLKWKCILIWMELFCLKNWTNSPLSERSHFNIAKEKNYCFTC